MPPCSLQDCQKYFDEWREFYNHERPHQSLDNHVAPAKKYEPSLRPFPEVLPPILYDPGEIVRQVDSSGKICFQNKSIRIGKAFIYSPVALCPTDEDGIYSVQYCRFEVAKIDIRGENHHKIKM
jgi:putative transposase